MSAREPRDESRRVLGHLRDVIEDADMTHRQIELEAGFSQGYLSQLLSQNIDLKYRHVLAVLTAIEVEPSVFFDRVYPRSLPTVRRPSPSPLEFPADREVANIYGFGVEALEQLRQRLERCETALRTLHQTGVIDAGAIDADRCSDD